MTADSEAFQGSLFGLDPSPAKELSDSAAEQFDPGDTELDHEKLLRDAEKRPRKRDGSTAEKVDNSLSQSSSEGVLEDEQLPPWAHHTWVDMEQLTPVMRHYVELKKKNPDKILLYRLGDFFECFFEDAIQLSRLLELTLTGKEGGKSIGRVPMAGIPHHSVERYCTELINKGLSVTICDQLETAAVKGSLLKRDITRVFTPGTVIEEGMLTARKNNWLAAVVIDNSNRFSWGLAIADVSTGEFLVTQRESKESLNQEIGKLEPSEILCRHSDQSFDEVIAPKRFHRTYVSNTPFSLPEAERSIRTQYKLQTLDGLGLNQRKLALRAAGGLLTYLRETKPISSQVMESVTTPIPLDLPKSTFLGDSLILDAQTRRNLEITVTQRDGQFYGSLLWALDRTLTAMGGRCLRRWLEEPLVEIDRINARQSVISTLVDSRVVRDSVRKLLRPMGDLERLAGRASVGQAGARDLVAIADGIERLPRLAEQIKGLFERAPLWIEDLINVDSQLIKLANAIRYKLVENPPLSLTDGGLIHDQVDPLLDGLRNKLDDQDAWLSSQEKIERECSGIANLKLQNHRTFGYFLSVSKARAVKVPEHWIRRQTLSNEERFITPALKEREGKIFQLKAKTSQREYELFCNLRSMVGEQTESIRKAARAVAGLDALTGLAYLAATENYSCPEIIATDDDKLNREIIIEECRHPVVEQLLADQKFIPNNLQLGKGIDLIILTGPNASGKSCYLRQIGLIQLLAQIGSWVPAKKARLSIADSIFTRVGAVDDLAAGQSTFMVEMAETAYILNHATKFSLVLLDEIGRGTATFDGLSIAWAVSEFLAKDLHSRTIFATHYHELNQLAESQGNVANFQVLVDETGDELIFLHKVAPGGASQSYGIEAARLAGVPEAVVNRARLVLARLEQNN